MVFALTDSPRGTRDVVEGGSVHDFANAAALALTTLLAVLLASAVARR